MHLLTIEPLSQEAFAPFGEVISSQGQQPVLINGGSTRRFHRLATVQTAAPEDQAIVSIFQAQRSVLPRDIRMLERHPLGSQAFIPLLGHPFLIVVAPPGEAVEPSAVRAFRSDGSQGVNYRRGVWHHPVLALVEDDRFLVIDREGAGPNCDEYFLAEELCLRLPAE